MSGWPKLVFIYKQIKYELRKHRDIHSIKLTFLLQQWSGLLTLCALAAGILEWSSAPLVYLHLDWAGGGGVGHIGLKVYQIISLCQIALLARNNFANVTPDVIISYFQVYFWLLRKFWMFWIKDNLTVYSFSFSPTPGQNAVLCIFPLKGVFAKIERGYRLNAIKKRFWSLLILLLSVASIRRKLLKTSLLHCERFHKSLTKLTRRKCT